jgi:hypothetical protein
MTMQDDEDEETRI